MTQQTTHVGSAAVEADRREILIQYGKPVTGSPQAKIQHHADFREVTPRGDGRTLTERLNEAYDEDAEREDEEFFRSTRAYYERRRNAAD
jgi:hypothetical protein